MPASAGKHRSARLRCDRTTRLTLAAPAWKVRDKHAQAQIALGTRMMRLAAFANVMLGGLLAGGQACAGESSWHHRSASDRFVIAAASAKAAELPPAACRA